MAAPLMEEGRFPAIQEISAEEFRYFINTCKNPPKPPEKLKNLFLSLKLRKMDK